MHADSTKGRLQQLIMHVQTPAKYFHNHSIDAASCPCYLCISSAQKIVSPMTTTKLIAAVYHCVWHVWSSTLVNKNEIKVR